MAVDLSEPVLDLAHLASFTDGDPELERELVDLYLRTAEVYLAELARARDVTGWQKTAHSLKGASANLGAMQAAALALMAERSTPAPGLLADLHAAVADVRRFFETRGPG